MTRNIIEILIKILEDKEVSNMEKIKLVVFLLLGLVILCSCVAKDGSYHLTAREKCYADNFCKSADGDCVVGSIILNEIIQPKDRATALLLSPLLCVGSKDACIADCNKKHPI